MKKNLKMMAWVSGCVGMLLMLIGIFARIAGGILLNHRWDNYFYSSGTFLLLGIFLFIGVRMWNDK